MVGFDLRFHLVWDRLRQESQLSLGKTYCLFRLELLQFLAYFLQDRLVRLCTRRSAALANPGRTERIVKVLSFSFELVVQVETADPCEIQALLFDFGVRCALSLVEVVFWCVFLACQRQGQLEHSLLQVFEGLDVLFVRLCRAHERNVLLLIRLSVIFGGESCCHLLHSFFPLVLCLLLQSQLELRRYREWLLLLLGLEGKAASERVRTRGQPEPSQRLIICARFGVSECRVGLPADRLPHSLRLQLHFFLLGGTLVREQRDQFVLLSAEVFRRHAAVGPRQLLAEF